MKLSRIIIAAGLLFGLSGLGVLVGDVAQAAGVDAREPLYSQSQKVAAASTDYWIRMADVGLLPDLGMVEGLPQAYPRPTSSWEAREREFYGRLLAGTKFDVLVVPFQIERKGFDRSTRLLMAAELADAIAQTTKWSIPDPHLVAKALGDGQRRIDRNDAIRLAESMGVKKVIFGYAGHDEAGHMSLLLQSRDRVTALDSETLVWSKIAQSLRQPVQAMTGDAAPIETFRLALPQMLESLGIAGYASVPSTRMDVLDLAELPASPLGFVREDDNAARDAYAFLILRALTPLRMERTREVFAEKAYLALSRLAPKSAEYAALRARILMALGSRDAAVKALGNARSNEERELQALLNGDLPRVKEYAAKERHRLKRLLQQLDVNAVSVSYGLPTQKRAEVEAEALGLSGDSWKYLVRRAFSEWDDWVQYDNASVKKLLDRDFRLPGYTLEDLVRGSVTVHDTGGIERLINLSVSQHVQRYKDGSASTWCCAYRSGRVNTVDYLNLLESVGHDNLIRPLRFYSAVQGRSGDAIRYADSIDAIYRGDAYYTVERARVELRLASTAGEAERESIRKSAYENAWNALYWEQGQSRNANLAMSVINATRRKDYGFLANIYYADMPFRPYYWTWANGGDRQTITNNMWAAYRNSTYEFFTFRALLSEYQEPVPDAPRIDALLASLNGRFNGSPQKNELMASEAQLRGDTASAARYLRENTKIAPHYWPSFSSLGALLLREGRVQEAASVWQSYPGFREDAKEDRVGTANEAYAVGSRLYLAGHTDLAVPFYRIAASQKSGADSELSSKARLRLLAGDLYGALSGLLTRVQRYSSDTAYRDYLGMLHALGYSKDAWAGFEHLLREKPSAAIWEYALTAHHRDGTLLPEVVQWAQQEPHKEFAAWYLTRFATHDRIPPIDLAETVNSLATPVWKLDDEDGRVVEASVDGSNTEILGPDTFDGRLALPLGKFQSVSKHRVRSHLSYYVAGYRALRLKRYAEAKAIFDEAAGLYDLNAQTSYMLPYYAFAQGMAGGNKQAKEMLERVPPSAQGFSYYLARAALAASEGKADEAFDMLEHARYRRPNTERRPQLTQYTFGEIAEWLALQTGEARITRLALDWARAFQRIQPWQSWSYAVELRLGQSPFERSRAIAMVHYLDPQSVRLSRVPKGELEQAIKAYEKSNPFLIQPPKRPDRSEL